MIGCAVIGTGYWGSKLKRYFEESPNFDVRHVCNTRSCLDEVWRDDRVGAIVVATPNHTHYDIVKTALCNGKNVLSEKPLALKTEECVELQRIARDAGLTLQVEYTYTFSRGLQQAQRMIERGDIGKVLGFDMAVRHLGRFKGGSVYWILGSHMLAALDMFLPIMETTFRKMDLVTCNGEVETGLIHFKKGDVSGQICVSLNYPGKETRVIIYGEQGTIVYNPVFQPALQVETYEKLKWTVAEKLPRRRQDFTIDESNNLQYVVEGFYDAITGKTACNCERAVAITRILEDIQRTDSHGDKQA